MDIQQARREIDAVDHELVKLFRRRMCLAAEIADDKRRRNLPVLDRLLEGQDGMPSCAGGRSGVPSSHFTSGAARRSVSRAGAKRRS